MRLAKPALAVILAVTLTLFHSPAMHAQPGESATPQLTPANQGVAPNVLPDQAAAPAAPAAEHDVAAQLPPAALAELQAAGDERWDERFQIPGTSSSVSLAVAGPNGTLYVVSEGELLFWNGRFWRSLGDSSFELRALALFRGELYAAGDFDSIGSSNVRDLARWDGARWRQVGTGVGPQRSSLFGDPTDKSLYALAVMGDTLYVGGNFNLIDGVSANNIAAWNGTSWSALGQGVRAADLGDGSPSDFDATVRVIEPAGGKLYVGGEFGYAGSQRSGSIGVWNGTAWSGVGGGLLDDSFSSTPETAEVRAIAVEGANIYVGGRISHAGSGAAQLRVANVARWNGAAWSDLDGGASADFGDELYALAFSGGLLYAGGNFDAIGGVSSPALGVWNGSAWQAIGGLETNQTVSTIARNPAGGLYIGGDLDQIGGVHVNHIVRYSGGVWKALGEGVSISDTSSCCAGQVYALVADGAGRIYAGGRFKTAGGVIANNLAMWDGVRWQALGAGVGGGDVRALALAGNTLYVGGNFTSAGGQAIPYVARYTISSGAWAALGDGVSGEVNALAYAAGTLFVGGSFDTAGDLDVFDLAFWDGAAWSAPNDETRIFQVFSSCNEAGSQVYALEASGRYLVVGGNFRLVLVNPAAPCSTASYRLANNMLLYDLVDDAWFFVGSNGSYGAGDGPGFLPSVRALEVVGPSLEEGGTLYVGGDFAKAGAVNASNLARWDLTDGWAAAGNTSGDNGESLPQRGVRALRQVGGALYVGGVFSSAGSAQAASLARLDLGTGAWSALGSGVAGRKTVYAIAASPDGLFAGGDFQQVGGKPSAGVARYTASVAQTTLGPAAATLVGEGATLSFPAGAATAGTSVTLTSLFVTPHPAPAGQAIVGSLRISAARGGQAVTSFARPYTLKISYSPALLAAAGVANAGTLNVVQWDGQKWVVLSGARVDVAARTVTVSASGSGELALIGTLASQPPPPGGFKLFLPGLSK